MGYLNILKGDSQIMNSFPHSKVLAPKYLNYSIFFTRDNEHLLSLIGLIMSNRHMRVEIAGCTADSVNPGLA